MVWQESHPNKCSTIQLPTTPIPIPIPPNYHIRYKTTATTMTRTKTTIKNELYVISFSPIMIQEHSIEHVTITMLPEPIYETSNNRRHHHLLLLRMTVNEPPLLVHPKTTTTKKTKKQWFDSNHCIGEIGKLSMVFWKV